MEFDNDYLDDSCINEDHNISEVIKYAQRELYANGIYDKIEKLEPIEGTNYTTVFTENGKVGIFDCTENKFGKIYHSHGRRKD